VRWPVYGLFGVNYFVSLIAVVVLLGVIGWCFETFFFRRMRKIATREENSMLLAVGTALLLENLALSSFGEKQRGVPPVVSGVFKIGDAFLPAGRPAGHGSCSRPDCRPSPVCSIYKAGACDARPGSGSRGNLPHGR
jgi:hypothetical protein